MTKQNPKNLSKSKIKRIHNNLFELEKGLSRFKKYKNRDYDDPEYRGRKFIQSDNRWRLLQTYKKQKYFNGNYIEYESKGDKHENLLPEKYLNMIKPYLSNIINDHKAPKKLRVHSSNEVIDYETQYED